mgnify:FL=1
MRIARIADAELRAAENCHGGAGHLNFASHWGENDFATPWNFVHHGSIPPGGGIGHHRHVNCEEMFVTFDNAAQFTHNGRTVEVEGGACVPCRKGESHAIYNHTDAPTRWMNFCVADPGGGYDATDFGEDRVGAALESSERIPLGRFDKSLLNKHANAHQGKGEIGTRTIWQSSDFRTHWGMVAHALLPPGTSFGYHRHQTIEETYVIINGSGRMTVDDETEEVYAGDSIPNKLGGAHGLYNHTQQDLEVFVMAVCMQRGEFDSEDLGDDLTAR